MKPSEGEWEKRWWELKAVETLLYCKADDGEIDEAEWQELIDDMIAHTMHGTANNVKRKLMLYRKES